MKKILTRWSLPILGLVTALSLFGYFLGSRIELKLSLTDLLPENHPAVLKFEKLTEVIGGVGYFAIVLDAQDKKSHLEVAPQIVEELKKSDLVRSVFYHREQRYFVDRLLYYVDLPKLRDLEKNIDSEVTRFKRQSFDLGLWDDEPKAEAKPIFDNELKEHARKSSKISPYLLSEDGKQLLIMVKPSFDSMDLKRTEDLISFSEAALAKVLPKTVTYEFAERYYSKVVESKMVKTDIFVLGSLSIFLIGLIILLYIRSIRGLLVIFVPVLLGMGITIGLTRLFIGHINIITGFLMGIVSGLGVDYGIHLLLRLQLENREPSTSDPDPVWRTLSSSGHSVFVGAIAASASFFFLCFSTFRAFSEFGFICGVGIAAVFICLLTTFSALVRLLKLQNMRGIDRSKKSKFVFPVLSIPRGLTTGAVISVILIALGTQVGFEYDFEKMLQHSKRMYELNTLVDVIYDRSSSPSALSSPDKETALKVEKMIKQKYMPNVVAELVSGASIIPEDQAEKQKVLARIKGKIGKLKDKWIEKSLDIPSGVVRGWVDAKPFAFHEIPSHVQDALRGTQQKGFLIYIYPAIRLSELNNVRTFANMMRDIETQYPHLLVGSDAVVFADILDLIGRDGGIILVVIFLSVGLFIWLNVRKWDEFLLSYLPLLIALPVGMGLMWIFGQKFNIFNIAIIPTFVAMGIDVPIHIVHRNKEIGSGYKAARDLAASINLALITAAIGFGVLVFARAGVLKSLGWIALLGTAAIWWIGLFVLPATLERFFKPRRQSKTTTVDSGNSAHAVSASHAEL